MATPSYHASQQILIGVCCFIAGLLTAAIFIVYFSALDHVSEGQLRPLGSRGVLHGADENRAAREHSGSKETTTLRLGLW